VGSNPVGGIDVCLCVVWSCVVLSCVVREVFENRCPLVERSPSKCLNKSRNLLYKAVNVITRAVEPLMVIITGLRIKETNADISPTKRETLVCPYTFQI
jgi:hypothetical protein